MEKKSPPASGPGIVATDLQQVTALAALEPVPEVWVPVPGISGGHQVSNLGRVRTAAGRILQGFANSPYPSVTLVDGSGVAHVLRVADIVACTFLVGTVHDCFVRHINGNVKDASAANLQFACNGAPPQIVDAVLQYHGRAGLVYLIMTALGKLGKVAPAEFAACVTKLYRKLPKTKADKSDSVTEADPMSVISG